MAQAIGVKSDGKGHRCQGKRWLRFT